MFFAVFCYLSICFTSNVHVHSIFKFVKLSLEFISIYLFLGSHVHGRPQLTIRNTAITEAHASAHKTSSGPRGSTVPSVSAEASSSAGINSTHLIFSVLQVTMLFLKKTQMLSALTSWAVSVEASSSAGINSTHLTFSVLQSIMTVFKKTMLLYALMSWTVSATASSSAGINSRHQRILVLQVSMVCLLRKHCLYHINVKNNFRHRSKWSRY